MEQTKQAAVGCVIMASGRAVRFGSDKLLADFGGAPLIARALAVTASPALAARVVVTRSAEVARLARAAGAATVLHSLPGRNDTVRLGLDALLGECPGLGGASSCPATSRCCGGRASRPWCATSTRKKETERVILRLGWRAGGAEPLLGSPVLFGSGHFDALRALPEGKGGGVVIRQHPGCVRAVYAQSAEELEDADTVERLEALKRFL